MDRFLQNSVPITIESTQSPTTSTLAQHLSIEMKRASSHVDKVTVSIANELVNRVLFLTTQLFSIKPVEGFQPKNVPLDYIQATLQEEIAKKMRSLFLRHVIVNVIDQHIQSNKIISSNYPRLTKVETPSNGPWVFDFDLTRAHSVELKEWRNFSFKQPKRKRYKDLDKQVINFLDHETTELKRLDNEKVEEQDWVFFKATLCNAEGELFEPTIESHFWINVKQHAGIDVLRDIFVGKRLGDSFVTNLLDMDQGFNEYENYRYYFKVVIVCVVKGGRLSLDLLKGNFRLKNKNDVHNKLMEVFSFRNDESQRRSTIEEVFHLLLSKHRFEVPKHLVLRRQEDLLLAIMKQPDYHVYKAQKDFNHHLELLAEKQLKEEILIDQIGFQEDIQGEMIDAQHYLHLFGNKKLHEFLYFKPVVSRLDQFNIPLNLALLQQTFTREKTLNYIIHTMIH